MKTQKQLSPLASVVSATSRPEPTDCKHLCQICKKTDMDYPKGCHKPSFFSPGVGDWVCNLQIEMRASQ